MSETAATIPGTRRSAQRLSVLALVALALGALGLLGSLTVSASPASAWQYAGTGGSVGSIPGTAQIGVGDTSGGQLTFFTSNGPIVTRTFGSTGAQDVYINYYVQKYLGGQWVSIADRQASVRIPAGYAQARLPNLWVQPNNNSSGYYRVIEYFQWTAAGSRTVLGASVIVPNVASDHACLTASRLCATSAGFVQVGRPYIFGGGWY